MTSDDKKRILSEIVFSRLDPADLPQVSSLIAGMRTEGDESLSIRTYAADYYRWMYYANPAGDAIVYVGKHHDRIVSSFAITPKRVQFGDKVLLVGKTMDMFTDPDYQGLGLIKVVTGRVFEDARRAGIDMWYVTPSKNSYPIFLEKWKYVESLRVNYIVRVLDFAAVLGAVVRPPLAGRAAGALLNLARLFSHRSPGLPPGIEARDERSFGSETDELWSRCRGVPVMLVRDAAYMTWRYLANPDRYEIRKFYDGGRLRGVLVAKFTKRRGLKVGEFVDVLAAPEDRAMRDALYRYGLWFFRQNGCAFAQNWAIEGSIWEAEMMACGIKKRRKKMALLFSPDAPRQEFYSPGAWYLTPGDGNDI